MILNKKIKKVILFENSSINDAIKSLNKSGLKIIIVVNNKKEFLGILQDSDIRRCLLKKYNLQSSIKKIINKRPFYIKSLRDIQNVRSSDLKYYDQIPVLKNKKIIELYIHSLERGQKLDQKLMMML